MTNLFAAAMHDSLTGLPNRDLFVEFITDALAAGRRGCPFAVLFLDLDRSKVVNDSLGHHAGDQLLAEVGRRLRDWARDATCRAVSARRIDVARIHGDEFGVVLHGLDDGVLLPAVARDLLRHVTAPVAL